MATIKLKNTIVNKIVLNVVDGRNLLSAKYSKILECDINMSWVNYDVTNIIASVINIDGSELYVNNCVLNTLPNAVPVITSNNNSKSIFNSITSDNILVADPEWTPFDASAPIYGNVLSYNIGNVAPIDGGE